MCSFTWKYWHSKSYFIATGELGGGGSVNRRPFSGLNNTPPNFRSISLGLVCMPCRLLTPDCLLCNKQTYKSPLCGHTCPRIYIIPTLGHCYRDLRNISQRSFFCQQILVLSISFAKLSWSNKKFVGEELDSGRAGSWSSWYTSSVTLAKSFCHERLHEYLLTCEH